jgi:hypothetical protein
MSGAWTDALPAIAVLVGGILFVYLVSFYADRRGKK